MDLNLLVAFDALYRERSVTRAGRRLGLSQPATSGALARLRAAFDDELFVKTPRGLEPTARCDAIATPIAAALEDLRQALGDDGFDPVHTDMTFRIGAVDAVIAVVLGGVVARVIREAPRARVVVRPIDPGAAIALLDAREVDLVVSPLLSALPTHVGTQELFALPFVVVTRPEHPLPARPSMADLARFPHVLVSFSGPPRSPVDEALEAAGHARHVAVVTSSFLAVPHVLRATDAIAIVPKPFGRELAALKIVECRPLPERIRSPGLRMRMTWPTRLERSPAWRWLRGLVAEVARAAA